MFRFLRNFLFGYLDLALCESVRWRRYRGGDWYVSYGEEWWDEEPFWRRK